MARTTQTHKGICLLIFLLVAAAAHSCTAYKSDPQQLAKYYTENYPAKVKNPKTDQQQKGSFWSSGHSETPLNVEAVALVDQAPVVEVNSSRANQGMPMMEETLSPPVRKYAAEDDLVGQNTASMIEGKIYNLVEDAYNRRDYNEFIKLYSLFVESFPHSSQKGFLDEKRKNFFYQEDLKIDKLQGALLELSYPDARTFPELGLYFEKLRDKGIKSIQVNVVQFLGTPVFLFANPQKGEGYYFTNSSNLTVDNVLAQITKMAHDNGLKVYASFPLRHHPRLGNKEVFMLDESWNMFQNSTSTNSKLDLLNPDSKDYLFGLIHDLIQFDIDGIVLKDDFTYELNEGFSMVARDRYLSATGQPLVFNKMFIPVENKKNDKYEILTSDEFEDVVTWRTREITQLLFEVVSYIKENRADFQVGIEVTPDMILEKSEPLKWRSTGLTYLKELNVDFYILKWRRYDSRTEADADDYKMAVQKLRDEVPHKKEIFLKIPLSQSTKNTIEFNRKIDTHTEFQTAYPSIKIAVGPVTRIERLDIMN